MFDHSCWHLLLLPTTIDQDSCFGLHMYVDHIWPNTTHALCLVLSNALGDKVTSHVEYAITPKLGHRVSAMVGCNLTDTDK